MNIFRDFFRFIVLHYDFISILLLSFALISLSIKVSKQQTEIVELKKEIYEIKLFKNANKK